MHPCELRDLGAAGGGDGGGERDLDGFDIGVAGEDGGFGGIIDPGIEVVAELDGVGEALIDAIDAACEDEGESAVGFDEGAAWVGDGA